jgi:ribosomal protein L17
MRHRQKKLLNISTGSKKKTIFIRSLLTSLVKYWAVTTTQKRAKVLKSEADSFFSKLIAQFEKYPNEKDAERECIKIVKAKIFGEEEWKKVISDILPKYRDANKNTSFVEDYKVWFRSGDASLKVLVKLS